MAGYSIDANIIEIFIAWLVLGCVIAVSAYDLRHKRIPNIITLPALLIGFVLHFPGTIEVWVICILLYAGWKFRMMGAGDAKLWMALLWLTPKQLSVQAIIVMGLSMILTALAQLVWRKLRHSPSMTGKRAPAAWRTIPFAVWLLIVLYVH